MLSASVIDIQLEKHTLWIPKYLPLVTINRFRSSCLASSFQPSPDLLKINIYLDLFRKAHWLNHFSPSFALLLLLFCCGGAGLGVTSDLLDHLGVLLHDVQEAVVRRHGRGPLFRGA